MEPYPDRDRIQTQKSAGEMREREEFPLDASELVRMLEAMDIPVLVVNEDLNVVCEVNIDRMGWKDARGRPLLELMSPVVVKDGELLSALRTMLSGERTEVEATFFSEGASRKTKTYLVRMSPIAKNGKFLGMLAFFDISREQKLREELAYLKDYSENVIRHIPSGLVVTDNDGRIVLANPAACEMLAAPDGLEGKNAEEIFGPELGRALIQGREPFREGQLEPGEVTIKRLDGVEIILGFRVAQLFDAHQRVVGMIIVFKDVTELKTLRNKLAQTDKMAALGTLASGIAHEFNNLLGAMLGYAQLAKATGGIENYKKCTQVVFECCRRAQEIVHNLLSFARRKTSSPEEMPLEDLIDQVLILVERDLEKHNIKVVRDYRYQDVIVTDVGQLQQVLLNLVINARQAMENRDGERVLTVSTWEEDGFVHIAVEDTGTGIPKKYLSRIFEPFFTTKGSGGTGLGLSLCYTLTKSLNGDIKVSSKYGKGSKFELILPQRLPVTEPVPKARLTRTLESRLERKKVLVVAEDGMMRDLISKMLAQLGHEVSATADSSEIFEPSGSFEPELVVIDMPPGDVADCERTIQEMKKVKQGVVVLCSLSGAEIEKLKPKIPKHLRVVSKPFEAYELIQAMEEVAL